MDMFARIGTIVRSPATRRGRPASRRAMLRILSVAALLAGCERLQPSKGADDPRGVTQQRIVNSAQEPGQWLTHYGDWRNRQFSPLADIDVTNVKELGLAWAADLDTNRGIEATPIVVDGVMYVTGSWSILYAFDALSGKRLWTFDPQVPREHGPKGCCDVVSRGVGVWGRKVLLPTFDGRLIAIDARSGRPVWTADTIVDRTRPYTITGAPLIANGTVVIGNGGSEYGVRGYVSAYDADTGKLKWRFYTVPGDPKQPFEAPELRRAAATWDGEWWKFGGGGTVWDSMAYDPELDLIYLGVGNGSVWNPSVRSPGNGDNLFLSSIVALDRKTGRYRWHFQETPRDAWDFTATQHIMLLDLRIGGRLRKTLVQAPKNGFFYVLDRQTGAFISGRNYVPVNWTDGLDPRTGRPRFRPGARYENAPFDILPGPTGGHNWQPMAYSPQTGLVYIPSLELGTTRFEQDDAFTYRNGFTNVAVKFANFAAPESAADVAAAAKQLRGDLIAWDPVRQREVWRVRHASPWSGGVLATAGGLVFQGTADGRFLAIDARSGRTLWESFAQTGIMAAPVSYTVAGEQFVSVAVGWGGHYGLEWGALARKASGDLPNVSRVLTFKLGGKAVLPEAWRLPPQPEPARVAVAQSPEIVARGRLLFTENCAACHGGGAVSGGVLPDLRYASADVHARWREIVLGGQLLGQGMPSFRGKLAEPDVEAIRAYVVRRARDTWTESRREGVR